MQWWCSSTGRPWTWTFQWYPGVDLMLLLLALAWWYLGVRHQWSRRPWGWFAFAWITLLATLDWPIGTLGAGYLASVHTAEFMLLTLGVGLGLVKCIPADGWLRIAPPGSIANRVLHFLAHAIPGLFGYTAIVLVTHVPAVVDGAMTSQLGSFAIDLSWILAGFLLWWPIAAPREFIALGVFGMIGYLFGATIGPTIPAMMMVFSDWPIYRLYELAPRVAVHFTANQDIKLAGLTMKIIGDIPIWIAAAVVFFRGTTVQGEMIDA
ncbi:MAG TPA: cytochrome c oxidase assembly protein [Gemmatimonadales bacterium]|jgi:putative membrane protein